MEGGDHQNHGNGGSRWNPTKEQISMLENLYRQGLRTPTAEQIHQITVRLRDFGHIEGKNVFYWFQNHKARQRQKQKQENFAFYNRFLNPTPVFSPYHHQNVVCSPCCITPQKNDPAVFYHHYPKVPLPAAAAGFKMSRSPMIPHTNNTDQSNKNLPTSQRYNKSMHDDHSSQHHQETLDLFPIHPTGILQSRNGIQNENKNNISCDTASSSDQNEISIFGDDHDGVGDKGHPFFDFFCKN